MTTAKVGPSSALTWWDRHPRIFLREVYVARKEGFHARIAFSNADEKSPRLIMRGRVRLRAAPAGEGAKWRGFDVDIAYPEDYPFAPLTIVPLDETVKYQRHQAGPSRELCYMQEELEPWVLGMDIQRAIEGARDWFVGYVTGVFENEVPAGELLAYLDVDSEFVRAVLIPGHVLMDCDATAFGGLQLEWDRYGQRPSLAITGRRSLRDPSVAKEKEVAVRELNDKLWRALRLQDNRVKGNTYHNMDGLWFRLSREPTPFHDLAGLEATLLEFGNISSDRFRMLVAQKLDARTREIGWLPIGFEYPRRRGRTGDVGNDHEWLFVALEWPKLPTRFRKQRKVPALALWPQVVVKGIPSFSVGPEDLRRRIGPTYSSNDLEAARIVVVGVGALGSTVARSLAAMGIGHITLVDPDMVRPGNVIRHEARFPDIGKEKITALRQILLETNPNITIDVLPGSRRQSGKFETLLLDPSARPSLVVVTVAAKAVDTQVDEISMRGSPPVPVLHAWVMAEAQMLRAFLFRLGETACVYCNGLYERDTESGQDSSGYLPGPTEKPLPFYEASCSAPAFPGAGNGNALAAHVIVEMALDSLQGRLSADQSHWVFAGNRIRDVYPALNVPPLCVVKNGFAPHPLCPVCSGEEAMARPLEPFEIQEFQDELTLARGTV
jgi:hypothetical protein